MEFHANKCAVLTASGKKAPNYANYKLHDQILARVKSAKYIGVIIIKSLDPLRAKKTFIRKKLDHTMVSAIKASSVTL